MRGERSGLVAERLREYRLNRRLTGKQLGQRLGVSKGTISKLENGKLPVTLDFVSRFCHELRLEADQARELMELACVVPQGAESGEFLQLLPFDFVSLDWSQRSQRTIAQWEQKSSTICVYQPFLIPGLLQSPEFATEVLRSAGIMGEASIRRTLASRMKRQRILDDRRKRFSFIIGEAALHHVATNQTARVAALQHILRLLAETRIPIGIVPLGSCLNGLPSPPFYLFDEHRVYLELPHGDLFLLQRSTAAIYARHFQRLRDVALWHDAAAAKLSDLIDQFERESR